MWKLRKSPEGRRPRGRLQEPRYLSRPVLFRTNPARSAVLRSPSPPGGNLVVRSSWSFWSLPPPSDSRPTSFFHPRSSRRDRGLIRPDRQASKSPLWLECHSALRDVYCASSISGSAPYPENRRLMSQRIPSWMNSPSKVARWTLGQQSIWLCRMCPPSRTRQRCPDVKTKRPK